MTLSFINAICIKYTLESLIHFLQDMMLHKIQSPFQEMQGKLNSSMN